METYLDVLPNGRTAVAVKTKGSDFNIRTKGLSSTGCWVVAKDRVDDYVIVFHETSSGNNVYIGEFAGKKEEKYTERQGKKYPRYRIFIKNIRLALTTQQTWTRFVCIKNGGFERIYLKNEGLLSERFLDPDSIEAEEGYRKDAILMISARDKKLVQSRKKKDDYTCQSCFNKFHINKKYIIDCHHIKPVALGKRLTTIDDLISLCPTCHRICHTRVPPYEPEELKQLVQKMLNK